MHGRQLPGPAWLHGGSSERRSDSPTDTQCGRTPTPATFWEKRGEWRRQVRWAGRAQGGGLGWGQQASRRWACTGWRAMLPRSRGPRGVGSTWEGGACTGQKTASRELRAGASGPDRGLGSCTLGLARSASQESGPGASGRARGLATASSSRGRAAAALLRVPEGREGGGPVSPASVEIAGLAGRPGHRSGPRARTPATPRSPPHPLALPRPGNDAHRRAAGGAGAAPA
ncbi:collagen alpha-2(I) chain-like [Cricetulus griseus]|uniref:Collagen alpha-2(I) chain-like n=1 Tax=Cricetulus griseus TaxID=10029 RepID=A0A9J7JZI1_CRIGR|nr:collagen alpha-2(I) chain-like [Cricetulus griseus]